jgi:voltage-gated potassium channel
VKLIKRLPRRLGALTRQPVFIWLTVLVHGLVFVGAIAIWILERDVNKGLTSFVDAIYWAVQTATTVGYGDVVTVTAMGKMIAVALMIGGSTISALYTALFAAALMAPELREVETHMREMEVEVKSIGKEVVDEEARIENIRREIEALLEKLKRIR